MVSVGEPINTKQIKSHSSRPAEEAYTHTHTHRKHTCKHVHMKYMQGRRDRREEAALEGGSGLGVGGHGPGRP